MHNHPRMTQRSDAGGRGFTRDQTRTTGPRLIAPIGTVPDPRRDLPRLDLVGSRDSAGVGAVRRLLAELRPFGPGPDEDPARVAPQGNGGSLAPRAGARAAWEVAAPAGAFRRLPPPLDALVCQRIARVSSERDRASLEFLRVSGHLRDGFAVLAVGLAMATAPADLRAQWVGATTGRDRARLWGAHSIERAVVAWGQA